MTDIPDYPWSIFRDALASTVGCAGNFLLVCIVAPYAPWIVFSICRFGPRVAADLLRPETLLWLPVHFPLLVILGLTQVWGLIPTTLLGLLFAGHVWWEWRAGATLLAVFLLVSAESVRSRAQLNGLESVSFSGILVFLALWLCGLAALVVLLRWRRKTTGPFVPLTGCRR